MKKIVFLFLLIVSSACGPDYDGETRLVFETRITDHNNNPVAGKYVQIQVLENGADDNTPSDNIISDGFTDADGYIRLIFPSPIGANARMTVHYTGNPDFQDKHISNISIYDFHNYKLDLSGMKLYRTDEITEFNILLDHTGNQTDLGAITIDAVLPDYYFDYGSGTPLLSQHYLFAHKVIKNQNVTVHYNVFDNSTSPTTITSHHDIVPVGNDPVDYTITY